MSEFRSFMGNYMMGKVTPKLLPHYIAVWSCMLAGTDTEKIPLWAFLGMTKSEYGRFVEEGEAALPAILSERKKDVVLLAIPAALWCMTACMHFASLFMDGDPWYLALGILDSANMLLTFQRALRRAKLYTM